MLPLFLDLARLRLVLVGNGRAALRRLALLEEAGAQAYRDFRGCAVARDRRGRGRSADAALAGMRGPDRGRNSSSSPMCPSRAGRARPTPRAAVGVLVHVEDEPALSDTQAPAVLRRGDAHARGLDRRREPGAGGRNSGISSAACSARNGATGLEEVSRQRHAWRKAGIAPETIAHLTGELVSRRGWLAGPCATPTLNA